MSNLPHRDDAPQDETSAEDGMMHDQADNHRRLARQSDLGADLFRMMADTARLSSVAGGVAADALAKGGES